MTAEQFIEEIQKVNQAINILGRTKFYFDLSGEILEESKKLCSFLKNKIEFWNSNLESGESFIFECSDNNSPECEIFTTSTNRICYYCEQRNYDISKNSQAIHQAIELN
jgi:hypothetical protein